MTDIVVWSSWAQRCLVPGLNRVSVAKLNEPKSQTCSWCDIDLLPGVKRCPMCGESCTLVSR
jgi:hypothetical protein